MNKILFLIMLFFSFPLQSLSSDDIEKWYDITSVIKKHNNIYKAAVLKTKKISQAQIKQIHFINRPALKDVYEADLYIVDSYKNKHGKEYYFYYHDSSINKTIPKHDVVIFATKADKFKGPYTIVPYENIFYSKDFENLYFNTDEVGKEFDSELFMKSQNFKCYSKSIAEQIVDKHLEKSEAPFQLLNRFDVRDQVRAWRVEGGIHFLGVELTKHCFKVGKKDCSILSCH